MSQSLATINTGLAQSPMDSEQLKEFRKNCENFLTNLNRQPKAESIDKTPDGKASTILISHIEMTLDEYFFGLWHTENFRFQQIANEIVGSIDLIVIHPVTNTPIKRVGAAAIQIMVDAVPEEVKDRKRDKNAWNLDMQNKKPNALDMGFPKLKAECLKNAAQSLGALFGRDLNRKKKDQYDPLITKATKGQAEKDRVQKLIDEATSPEHLTTPLWEAANTHGLIALFNEKRKALGGE